MEEEEQTTADKFPFKGTLLHVYLTTHEPKFLHAFIMSLIGYSIILGVGAAGGFYYFNDQLTPTIQLQFIPLLSMSGILFGLSHIRIGRINIGLPYLIAGGFFFYLSLFVLG